MKIPFKWLKQYVDIPCSPEELAEKLSKSGTEVEGLTRIGENLSGILTARIDKIERHPNADRLVITQVFDGSGTRQIVTGAKNISEGDIVPLSIPGSVLANGTVLKEGVLRGVESKGMLCAETELGVAEESEGIWILPKSTPVGVDFVDFGHLKDVIIEIGILPNRGDCQSIIGVAREVAAIFNIPLEYPKTPFTEIVTDTKISIQNHVPKTCPLYIGRYIENVQIGPSPIWLQRLLQLCDIRPINNVVDITNFVLLEFGQPLHAFDADKLDGLHIDIRNAKTDETFEALDSRSYSLKSTDIVVSSNQTAVALAGVMGGLQSEVKPETSRILLEAAVFDAMAIRKTSQHSGLRSESSIRFEKQVDPNMTATASDRAASLLAELSGANISTSKIVSKEVDAFIPVTLPFNPGKINQLLGTELSEQEMIQPLSALGFEIDQKQVRVPSWRKHDVAGEADLAEEIARIYGYDRIAIKLPQGSLPQEPLKKTTQQIESVIAALVANGFSEVVTMPLVDPIDLSRMGHTPIQIVQNPLTPEESVMRTHLLPSILKVLAHNTKRQQRHLKLFECATIEGQDSEPIFQITGLLCGLENPAAFEEKHKQNVSFQWIKGLVETLLQRIDCQDDETSTSDAPYLHPSKHLVYQKNSVSIAEFGFLHPGYLKNYGIDVPVGFFSITVPNHPSDKAKNFKRFSKYPSTRRDIALLAPKTLSYQDIAAAIQKIISKTVVDFFPFDYFESEKIGLDNQSWAFAFIYQHPDQSLSDAEVNEAHEILKAKLMTEIAVTIR